MAIKLNQGAVKPRRPTSSTSGVFRADAPGPRFLQVELHRLTPKTDQPRRMFDAEALEQLADSIRRVGLLQPPLVRPLDQAGAYEVVAGERRWRAAKMAGLTVIDVVVTTGDADEIALVENMQRQDLRPIEEAIAVGALIAKHGYTHEVAAKVLNRGRQWVTDTLALLTLPSEIQQEALEQPDVAAQLLIQIARMDPGPVQDKAWTLAKAGELTVRAARAMRQPAPRSKARSGQPSPPPVMTSAASTPVALPTQLRNVAQPEQVASAPPFVSEHIVSTRTVTRAVELLRARFMRPGGLTPDERQTLLDLKAEIEQVLAR